MPLRYQKRLLAFLATDGYEPMRVHQVAEELRVEDKGDFAEAVDELAERGMLDLDDNGRLSLPSLHSITGQEIEGEFRASGRGFGFVQLDADYREGDVFIPPDRTMDAMSGDRVKIVVQRDRKGRGGGAGAGRTEDRFRGEVLEILTRAKSTFTGELFKQGGQWLIQPDGRDVAHPIVIRDAESKNAKEGLKVAVDILHYPEGGTLAEGVITKVLGEAGRPDVETEAVIAAYNLPEPGEFPEACVRQARELTKQFDDDIERFEQDPKNLPDRLDYTNEFVITIDPPDAKDYDDAISLKKTDRGWELGVHIADVAHFIEPGTPLDVEGKQRGNSTYLPRLVIPMLPEILSNGICSLQERVHRFAKTAFMRYDHEGNVTGRAVASTVIKSAKRLTYLEAQALIDGNEEEAKKHARTDPDYTDELRATLRELNALAQRIEARRVRQGMISLDLPEVELVFNEDGRVVDAEREDDAYTHKVIEMFMVEANETLAKLFESLDVPLLRRTHPDPTPGESDALQKAATVAGFTIPPNPTREELQGLLNATRGTDAARAVHMAVLRTLTKAEYSPALIGHFALASEAYAHFTSPIRRYPDLTVHWALGEYLRNTNNGDDPPKSDEAKKALGRELKDSPRCPPQADLVEIGRHCTRTEENSAGAERELRQFLVLQLLEEHIGEEFKGVVTGVVPRGVFVQIDPYMCDGMIKAADLPGDETRSNLPPKWVIDKKTGALVDKNSGRSFKIGDLVRVIISAVDLPRRELDLAIADGSSRSAGKAKGAGLTLGGGPGYGGLGGAEGGAGFKDAPGGTRRSRKSKQRDRNKKDYRDDRKKKRGR
ncbi:MAG: VacB/RNase II family 3'-5' exoribonuclease [Planctomycetota bacterium]